MVKANDFKSRSSPLTMLRFFLTKNVDMWNSLLSSAGSIFLVKPDSVWQFFLVPTYQLYKNGSKVASMVCSVEQCHATCPVIIHEIVVFRKEIKTRAAGSPALLQCLGWWEGRSPVDDGKKKKSNKYLTSHIGHYSARLHFGKNDLPHSVPVPNPGAFLINWSSSVMNEPLRKNLTGKLLGGVTPKRCHIVLGLFMLESTGVRRDGMVDC